MSRLECCEECGEPFEYMRHHRITLRFCSDKCPYRNRDRKKYERDPEGERAKSRAYYARNREKVIARVIETRKRKAAG